MGIYNCASTLQEALDSLYAQTFQDFEIILCEDGSTDNTYELALKNSMEHPNVVLLRNERNLGLNITLNNCLAVAKGEYIARMDGDDISLPERFEKEVGFLDAHPEYAIVSCPMIYFDESGEFMRGKGKGEIAKPDFIKGSPIPHASCMVRKEAFDSVGGYGVGRRLLRVEDYHLWFKMYAAGFKAFVLSKPYYAMRDDRNAIKRRKFRNNLNEACVRFAGYRLLGLPVSSYVYALRPIAVGLLPRFVYVRLHRRGK